MEDTSADVFLPSARYALDPQILQLSGMRPIPPACQRFRAGHRGPCAEKYRRRIWLDSVFRQPQPESRVFILRQPFLAT